MGVPATLLISQKTPCTIALYHYNLAEQVPGQVWVLVPPGKRTRVRGYKLIRTKTRLDREIVDERGYRIVTVERAVLEG